MLRRRWRLLALVRCCGTGTLHLVELVIDLGLGFFERLNVLLIFDADHGFFKLASVSLELSLALHLRIFRVACLILALCICCLDGILRLLLSLTLCEG